LNLAERISNAELEVMRILWREGEPVSFADIRTELHTSTSWETSTISTMIRRLADKGVVTTLKQGVLYCAPNISEQEYIHAEQEQMLNKLYSGSAKKLVASLVSRGKLTKEDIDDLKEYFRMEGSDSD
jgi:BlaI family penicillinase repressor